MSELEETVEAEHYAFIQEGPPREKLVPADAAPGYPNKILSNVVYFSSTGSLIRMDYLLGTQQAWILTLKGDEANALYETINDAIIGPLSLPARLADWIDTACRNKEDYQQMADLAQAVVNDDCDEDDYVRGRIAYGDGQEGKRPCIFWASELGRTVAYTFTSGGEIEVEMEIGSEASSKAYITHLQRLGLPHKRQGMIIPERLSDYIQDCARERAYASGIVVPLHQFLIGQMLSVKGGRQQNTYQKNPFSNQKPRNM
jgi:hypothetical protein